VNTAASRPEPDQAAAAESFYSGAYTRIVGIMLFLALLGSAAFWVAFGQRWGIGFLIGSAIALLNFHWLKRMVAALADRATRAQGKSSTAGVVVRFLLRYLLIAVAAYAIVRGSSVSVYGLLAGLFLPVAAIFVEAGYELYGALRRGF